MNEIYWLTRLDGLSTFLYVVMGIGILITFISAISYIASSKDSEAKTASCYFRWGLAATLLVSFLAVLTPNTSEAFMIYGIGSTVDYLKSNEVAKKLPDKCIDYLDAWVDKMNLSNYDKNQTGFDRK